MAIQVNARPAQRKLTDQQVVAIRKAGENSPWVIYSALAREYGVGVETIKNVLSWKTYRDVFPHAWGE